MLVQHILRVQDGRSFEFLHFLEGVFLQAFKSEDALDVFVKEHIVDLSGVAGYCEVLLEQLEFFVGQLDLLGVEHSSEFLSCDVALAKEVVVLEEFT